jgi:myo-inositol-1(or 4)-monophosphatase
MRLRVADSTRLDDTVIAIADFAVADDRDWENPLHIAFLRNVAPRALGVRTHGSAALDLAWIAAGHLGASIMLSNRAWDVSAGILLVRESGGVVYDLDSTEHDLASRCTLASLPGLKEELLALLPPIAARQANR